MASNTEDPDPMLLSVAALICPTSINSLRHIYWGWIWLCISCVVVSAAAPVSASSLPINPLVADCIEGEFLHLESGTCLPLQTTYGFDAFPEPETVISLESCELPALRDALSSSNRKVILKSGCTYALGDGDLRIRSNTVIEGAGPDNTKFTCTGTTAFRIHDVRNVILRNLTVDGLNNQQPNRGCGTLVFIDRRADNVLVERVRLQNGLGKGVGFRTATRVTVRYSSVENMWQAHGLNADKRFEDIAYYSNYITNVGISPSGIGYGINSHAAKAEIAGNYVENTDSGVKLMGARYTLFHHNTVTGATASNPLYRGVWTAIDDKDRVRPEGLVFYANTIDTDGERPFSVLDGATEIYFAGNTYGDVSSQIPISDGSRVYRCANSSDTFLKGRLITIESARLSFPDSGMDEFDPCSLHKPSMPALPLDSALGQSASTQLPIITQQPSNLVIEAEQQATFSVQAESAIPLTYQWQVQLQSGIWYNLSKATKAFYKTRVRSAVHGDARYRVVVTNDVGQQMSEAVSLVVHKPDSCWTTSESWQSSRFPSMHEQIVVSFSAVPSTNQVDALVGLSLSSGTNFTDLAVIVRFAESGRIDVRNGSDYEADKTVTYQRDLTYHFRLLVDIQLRQYDVFIRMPDGSEIQLADQYAFRSEQKDVVSLDSWTIWSGTGELEVCDRLVENRQ